MLVFEESCFWVNILHCSLEQWCLSIFWLRTHTKIYFPLWCSIYVWITYVCINKSSHTHTLNALYRCKKLAYNLHYAFVEAQMVRICLQHCSAGESGLISGSGRSPGEGNGKSLQHSCLENSTDRRAWQAIVPGVTKSHRWQSE